MAIHCLEKLLLVRLLDRPPEKCFYIVLYFLLKGLLLKSGIIHFFLSFLTLSYVLLSLLYSEALDEMGINLNAIEDQEPDPALGNGGLGAITDS